MPATQSARYRVPHGFDVTRPTVARIQDYLLFGKDNFAADRAVAAELAAARIDPQRLALASRDFLRRAVRLIASRGVGQFVDLGCGLPACPNVHEVARAVQPFARVAYVDNDPVVTGHIAARLATPDGVLAVEADIRTPDRLIDTLITSGALHPDRPAAVLLVDVLHFITDAEDPAGLIAAIRDRLAPGSYLVLSAAAREGARPGGTADIATAYAAAGVPFTPRPRTQLTRFFDGFDLLDPGIVSLPEWRPVSWTDRTPLQAPTLGGVGRLAP